MTTIHKQEPFVNNSTTVSSVLADIEALPIDEENEELILVRWNHQQVPNVHGKYTPLVYDDWDVSSETLYIASGTFKPGKVRGFGRSNENLARVLWIPLDCDLDKFLDLPKREVYAFSEKRLFEEIKRLFKRFNTALAEIGIQVDRIDYTGYGICGYIYLDSVTGAAKNYHQLSSIAKTLIKLINKEVGRTIIDPAASDPGTRITRVPGSPNIPKPGAAPEGTPIRYSRTLYARPKAERTHYTLDDLFDITDAPIAIEDFAQPTAFDLPVQGPPIPDDIEKHIVAMCKFPCRKERTHDPLHALAGFLADPEWCISEQSAEQLIYKLRTIYSPNDPLNEYKAKKAVSEAWSRVRAGKPVTGWTALRALNFSQERLEELVDSLEAWVDERAQAARKQPNSVFSFGGQSWTRNYLGGA